MRALVLSVPTVRSQCCCSLPGMRVTMIGQRVHSRIKEAVDLRQGLIPGSINGNPYLVDVMANHQRVAGAIYS